MRKFIVPFVLVFTCQVAGLAPLARGEILTVPFQGVVTNKQDSGDPLPLAVDVGDVLTGSYTFDTDKAPSHGGGVRTFLCVLKWNGVGCDYRALHVGVGLVELRRGRQL